MMNTVLDHLTEHGKYPLFSLPASEELRGREAVFPDGTRVRFGEETAVKCDDDLFLAEREGRVLLVRELSEEHLTALDAAKAAESAGGLPRELEGWVTDLSFASGCVRTAAFGEGRLSLSPSPEPELSNLFPSGGEAAAKPPEPPLAEYALRAVELDEKRFLLLLPETGEVLLLNARRFLFYAVLGGRIAAGFAEVPPR